MIVCTNANFGTFGHECGRPAEWAGVQRSGHVQHFCSRCKDEGDEARTVVEWRRLASATEPTEGSLKARIITTVEGQLVPHEIDAENLVAFMEVRGHFFTRLNDNPRQRAELQGQPKFTGMNGPMWDGDAIRYEDPEACRQLSA